MQLLPRRCNGPVANVQQPGLCSPALLGRRLRSGSRRPISTRLGWGGVHRRAAGLQAGQRGREWPPGAARGGQKAVGAPHSAGAARPSRSCPTRGIAAPPRVLTGEKNEKKRAGRMSRTQAEIDFEWFRINSDRSKLGLGCVLPPKNVGCPRGKTRFLNERLAGVRVATPQMGSKIGPKHLVFWSFTGKHGGATPPPNKQETRKPRNKLPQESRKTCKNMVFLYTGSCTLSDLSTSTCTARWSSGSARYYGDANFFLC